MVYAGADLQKEEGKSKLGEMRTNDQDSMARRFEIIFHSTFSFFIFRS